jgi:hypothetical protein
MTIVFESMIHVESVDLANFLFPALATGNDGFWLISSMVGEASEQAFAAVRAVGTQSYHLD